MRVNKNECASLRLLARDGWSIGELKMTFQITDHECIYNHVEGDCLHQVPVKHIRDWDGQTPPKSDPFTV